MRSVAVFAGVLVLAAVGAGLPGAAGAAVSIGVHTDDVHLDIDLGRTPPPLVVVPEPVVVVSGPVPPPPVYYAPSVSYNYFVYNKVHYVYREGRWFRAWRQAGPWLAIPVSQVPRRVLAVPVTHYRHAPAHWDRHGAPPWKHEREREREWEREWKRRDHARGQDRDRDHGRDRGHDQDRGHDRDRGHGKGRH
jgi:hypothetical protein